MGRKTIRKKVTASKLRACGEKKKYATREAAAWAARKFMEAEPWVGEKVPYPCPYSHDHFHIGAPLGRK